jgi:NADP-dependent 3-hydroxy acid dehydrogenase YdfG
MTTPRTHKSARSVVTIVLSDNEMPGHTPPGKEVVMKDIEGKVIAITGASSGIGEATALLLAERGAKVVLGARGSERLANLAKRIEDAGGTVALQPTDVRRRSDLATLVGLACDRYGKLDVLFSNAGVMPISPVADLRVADWDEMIDINLKGVLYGIAAALPIFRKQGFGHFVNTASTAGLKTVPTQAIYSGTKFAVRAISEGLRQEVGSEGLRVTVISPGFTRTNFADAVVNTDLRARLIESRDTVAMSPAAVARAVLFAIEQPADVDVGEIVIRATAQA